MNKEEKKAHWFPAKKFGWGWSAPTCWQGWVSLMIYVLSITIWSILFNPVNSTFLFTFGIMFLSALLVFTCLLKGEKPKWRWEKSQLTNKAQSGGRELTD